MSTTGSMQMAIISKNHIRLPIYGIHREQKSREYAKLTKVPFKATKGSGGHREGLGSSPNKDNE